MNNPQLLRGIYCNRTLNLRAIRAIGYDMDYTLIHYRVDEWEKRAYEHLKQHFVREGWPVAGFEFDPRLVCRGLVIDTDTGNLVKCNRFGFIKRAVHGTKLVEFEKLRELYARTIVDLSEPRWVFLNTLFSLSEGCMYSQLVDLIDQREAPVLLSFGELYRQVRNAIDAAHMEGQLKAEIVSSPDCFVEQDPDVPLALLDQRNAGKKLLLITNSEWAYTQAMMTYAFDRHLPAGTTWRDLFDVVIVSARKPEFFTSDNPLFEVVTEQNLLQPNIRGIAPGKVYFGGSVRKVEKCLGLSGDEILYVGDHMFGDVHVTKNVLRWRTALILRELEGELEAVDCFRANEIRLTELMEKKEKIEHEYCQRRVLQQRVKAGYAPVPRETAPHAVDEELQKSLAELRAQLEALDREISPLAKAASEIGNPTWGLLMRTGNDKSHLAFQIERYADVYTSRVSNFLHATPFAYLRSLRGSLPHDQK